MLELLRATTLSAVRGIVVRALEPELALLGDARRRYARRDDDIRSLDAEVAALRAQVVGLRARLEELYAGDGLDVG